MGMEIVTFLEIRKWKPIQKCKTIKWSSKIFGISSQYEIFSM